MKDTWNKLVKIYLYISEKCECKMQWHCQRMSNNAFPKAYRLRTGGHIPFLHALLRHQADEGHAPLCQGPSDGLVPQLGSSFYTLDILYQPLA